MKPAAGSFVVLFASALLTGAASAASIDSAYDMERLLYEPHPLAHEYGTRWRPAPVQPTTPPPQGTYRPATQPRMTPMMPAPPPVAIPPPALLPAAPPTASSPPPATSSAPPAAEPAITPNLAIDDPGWPKAPAVAPPPPPAPPPKTAATAGPAPPPPQRPARQRSADAGKSRVRVGARAPRPGPSGGGWLSEVRVGALYHDQGPFSHNKEEGIDANVELLFASPPFMEILWSPRPHIGVDMNTKGDTSSAYLGLSWEWEFWRTMFAGFSLGGAVHNGKITNAREDRKELGCRVLFRESIELGFRFAERHSISGFLDHISNAKLCSTNEGLENAGIRYGYKF